MYMPSYVVSGEHLHQQLVALATSYDQNYVVLVLEFVLGLDINLAAKLLVFVFAVL